VACTGAKPEAVTDGLNFGNPTLPHVYWQFERAVRGIADAAEAMRTPVISGNVSFYNESDLGEVLPTPLIGMLGILDDAEMRVGLAPGRTIGLFLLSIPEVVVEQDGLGASLYVAEIFGREDGYPVAPSLEGERRLCLALNRGVMEGTIRSAHDSSEGGLAVALAEIAMKGGLSAKFGGTSIESALFGEIPGRVIVSTEDSEALAKLSKDFDLTVEAIGVFGEIAGMTFDVNGTEFHWSNAELISAYENAIPGAIAKA
jgi:phosphoribosylformylglycinamidine synthase